MPPRRTAKGQTTLDAANARKAKAAAEKEPRTISQKAKAVGLMELSDENMAKTLTMDPRSGYERPKSLGQLEHIVEENALRGAGLWKKAATALLAIKTHKLWRSAKDKNDQPYGSFVLYAEDRFGFKKTYAYDLVKAAQRKPEALTEGSARREMDAARKQQPLAAWQAVERMQSAFDKFQNRAGDLRDRVEDPGFLAAYDEMQKTMFSAFESLKSEPTAQKPIAAEAVEVSAPAENDEDDDGGDDS